MDASFLHNDWWQRVRDLFHPQPEEEEGDEEEEEDGEEVTTMWTLHICVLCPININLSYLNMKGTKCVYICTIT